MLGQVAPALLAPHTGSTTFDVANPVIAAVGTEVDTAAFCKLSNNAAGEWTAGLTLTNLAGDTDLHLAMWSPNVGGTPALALTNEAAACNTADNEYLLQLEPTQGLLAVFDRFAAVSWNFQGVFLTARGAVGTPFGTPVPIAGVQGTNGWGDPSIGYVDGQLMLFYGGTGQHPTQGPLPAILMAPIDLTNPQAPQAGAPVPVAFPVIPGRSPHSPTPIVGPDGDVEGLLLAEVDFVTGDSDTYFADDLDALTPHVLTFDTTGWLNGDGLAGGYIATGDYGAFYQQLREARAAWLIGDADPMTATGVTIDLLSGSPHAGAGVPNLTFFVASLALLPSPIPAPAGILGEIGLGSPQIALGLRVAPIAEDELTTWSATLPFTPGMNGVVFHVQAGVVQPGTGVALLTNTAKIAL
ncbi:MAG: hypothetical protein KDE27_15775 [Planctomycetes bacterium]|nr:hypothetical protein [Planctomycetota bacterium]